MSLPSCLHLVRDITLTSFDLKALGEYNHDRDRTHNGLQSNLYQLQLKSGNLLPDFNLGRGEVQRIGKFPVSGSAAMDIWEGMYLGGEKVAVKVIRAVNSDEKSLRVSCCLLQTLELELKKLFSVSSEKSKYGVTSGRLTAEGMSFRSMGSVKMMGPIRKRIFCTIRPYQLIPLTGTWSAHGRRMVAQSIMLKSTAMLSTIFEWWE